MAEPQVLNKKMSEAFDWSDDSTPVRDALWNYYMENNDHDTMKVEKLMEPYLDMSDADVEADAVKLLKK